MGTWSVGLYDGDTALDVKGRFAVWSRIPGPVDDLVKAVLEAYPAASDETDEDYPDLWLSLADQLHAHGLEHAETLRRARHVIASGLDLATKRALGLTAKDERKRAAVLGELMQRWQAPHPRPRRPKVLAKPEEQAFATGTVVTYPTCGGEARNHADARNLLGWSQDGWGSGIILATGHERGWLAWAAAGRLSVHGRDKPTLVQCLSAAIESQPWSMCPSGEGTIAVQVGALPPLLARRMGFEALGEVSLDPAKVAALDAGIGGPKRLPAATLHQVWTWWAPGVQPMREKREAGFADPKPVVALAGLLV